MAIHVLRVRFTWAGVDGEFGGYVEAPDFIADLESFANAYGLAWDAIAIAFLSDQLSLNDLYIRNLTPGFPGLTVVPSGWPATGGQTTQPMNLRDCINVRLTSTTFGLPHYNMIQLPGLTEGDTSAGKLVEVYRAAVQEAVNTLLKAGYPGDAEDIKHVLWSDTALTHKTKFLTNVTPRVGKRSTREG